MKTLNVRMSDRLHGRVRSFAREEGMSLNQFLLVSASHEIVRQETLDFFKQAAKRYSPKSFEDALASVPDVPPQDDDKLE